MGKQNKIISKNKVINVVLICDNYGLAINIENILLDKKMIPVIKGWKLILSIFGIKNYLIRLSIELI